MVGCLSYVFIIYEIQTARGHRLKWTSASNVRIQNHLETRTRMCTWIVTVHACAVYTSTTTFLPLPIVYLWADCGKPVIPTTLGSYSTVLQTTVAAVFLAHQPLTNIGMAKCAPWGHLWPLPPTPLFMCRVCTHVYMYNWKFLILNKHTQWAMLYMCMSHACK